MTIEEIKEAAAALRDGIEEYLDENETTADPETLEILYALEAGVNEWLGDVEEMPQ